MKPDIQRVLRAANIDKSKEDSSSITDKLNDNDLSIDQVLAEASYLLKNTSNEGIKKSMIDTILKCHGALKDQAAPMPGVTIIIKDNFSDVQTSGVNPILIPRKTAVAEKESLLKEETIQ